MVSPVVVFVCHYTRGHPRPPEAVSALPTPELHLPEVHPSLNRPRLGGTSPEASPEVHPCLGRPSGALPPEAQAARGPPERKPSVRASNRVGGLVVHVLVYVRERVRACVRVRVHLYVRVLVCVRVRVHAYVHVCVRGRVLLRMPMQVCVRGTL